MGGCAKFLSVLTRALGFIGFFVVGGWLLQFNYLLISIPSVALAAAYALNAPDDFFQDHPMLVVAIAATSGLLGLGLMAVPFTLDTKTSSDTEPGLALPVVAVFVVAWSLAALFLVYCLINSLTTG